MSLPGGKGKSRLTLVTIVLPGGDSPSRLKSFVLGMPILKGESMVSVNLVLFNTPSELWPG
ncbi:unnamed protein product [Gulo gulo]|uniref:Uncharacterized protein n=1 Tax=Gulo gulo TaxID=48420 RepID=A0A9X9PUL5_GULGU|nr:unnamed protein product [Gulo gulo]